MVDCPFASGYLICDDTVFGANGDGISRSYQGNILCHIYFGEVSSFRNKVTIYNSFPVLQPLY
jgi:hypothetical protein